jgi:hypothetical protein
MKKAVFKDQFSVVVKVGNKMTTFAKSADSREKLVELLEKHGMGVSNIVAVKTFQVAVEKQRGRTGSKY